MKSAKLSGVLLVGKPAGMTSNDVLTRLKHVMRTAWGVPSKDLPKIGHTGTLDPFATGMLPVVLGGATRIAQFLLGAEKSYRGVIRFGVHSPSHDPETLVEPGRGLGEDGKAAVERAARSFVDMLYLQTPPMFSAKRVDGERLYDLARRGETVKRDAVPCTVHQFDIEWMDANGAATKMASETEVAPLHRVAFRARVSSGTFIRVLAVDLAERVHADAILESLHRESVGAFSESRMVSLADIEDAILSGKAYDEIAAWIPLDQSLAHLPSCAIDAAQTTALQNGQQGSLPALLTTFNAESPVALYHAEHLIAVATAESGTWRLACVV